MKFNHLLLFIVLLTAFLRGIEIALGEINAKKMLREGGKEFAPEQRWPILGIYTLWLLVLAGFTPAKTEPNEILLGIFVLLQIARWWGIAHLGKFWTTRVIVVPLALKITSGPYRFMRHPIYAVLILEVLILSLAFGQIGIGCFFTALTAWWVYLRMGAESRALQMML